MTIRRCLLTHIGVGSLLVLAGCAGEKNTDGASDGPLTLETSAWDAVVSPRVTQQPQVGGVETCTDAPLTLHFETSSSGLKMIAGRDGSVGQGTFERTDAGYELEPGSELYLAGSDGCLRGGAYVHDLSLRVEDEDGDGKPDRISGSGVGSAQTQGGDVTYPYELELTLTAKPDQTAPKVVLPDQPVDPFFRLFLPVTEPLPATSNLSLHGSSDIEFTPLMPDSVAAVVGFETERVLPFGGEWSVTTSARDFAGLALVSTTTLRTVEDPGVFLQDGFESGSVVGRVNGSIEVVTGFGTLPALAGKQSLFVRSDGSASFHLVRDNGQKTLRARVRALFPGAVAGVLPGIAAGVVGSDQHSSVESVTLTPTLETGDSVYRYSTPETEISLALVGAGSDVVVAIQPAPFGGIYCPVCGARGALLLDELRLE